MAQLALPRLRISAFLAALGPFTACDVARPVAGSDGASSVCTACHGDATRFQDDPVVRAAPPASVGGRGGGAHLVHLRGSPFRAALACSECHDVPSTAGHTNGVIDLPLRGLARAGGASPSWNDPTCSGVYCHGATLVDGPSATPSWFTAGSVTCGSCHGAPPKNHDPSSTNCNACHPGTVKPNGEIDLVKGLHIDGKIEVNRAHSVPFSASAPGAVWTPATLSCGTFSCHGESHGSSRTW